MTPKSSLAIQLTLENKKLREKLTIAEQWIGREISDMHLRKIKEETHKKTKIDLNESESEIIKRIKKYLGKSIDVLTDENQECLVESEVNFSHLIRKKNLDGIMVSSLYQKILEDVFEIHVTQRFREKYKKSHLHPKKNDLLEKTLYKVIHDDFRLSIGKIFQILQKVMEEPKNDMMQAFQKSVMDLPFAQVLDEPQFWEYMTDLIETHAFGGKRHSGKITFQDIRSLRETMTGNFERDGLLRMILSHVA